DAVVRAPLAGAAHRAVLRAPALGAAMGQEVAPWVPGARAVAVAEALEALAGPLGAVEARAAARARVGDAAEGLGASEVHSGGRRGPAGVRPAPQRSARPARSMIGAPQPTSGSEKHDYVASSTGRARLVTPSSLLSL